MLQESVSLLRIFLVLVSLSPALAINKIRESTDTGAIELLNELYQTENRVRPGIFGGPTVVFIDFFVQSFGPLDEIDRQFGINVDFRQTWVDPRLNFTSDVDTPVFIPAKDVHRFWIPDVYFPNEKYGRLHDITIPNKSLRIYRNGTVRYFSRMAMDLMCTMDLKTYPLDSQVCDMKISTYSYDSQAIELKWLNSDPIEIRVEELNLPQFQMESFEHGFCNETYETGVYSCLQAEFRLKRNVGYFVLHTYIPSMLIVMLSWVGFWINKNSEPARVSLGVTTVLTMTTQLTSSGSTMMRVSYLKAIDVWYSTCMIFVFAALMEYALVNVSVRSEKKISDDWKQSDPEKQLASALDSESEFHCLRPVTVYFKNFGSKSIDQMSRKVFPVAFLAFNIIYWIVYGVIF